MKPHPQPFPQIGKGALGLTIWKIHSLKKRPIELALQKALPFGEGLGGAYKL